MERLRVCTTRLRSQWLRSRWDSSWWDARRTGSKSWVYDKTKVAGIGTVALPNRPADSEAGGSGAAAAEWPAPVTYGASAHSAHEFSEVFIQSSIYFSQYSSHCSQYSSDMISNMISPVKRGQIPCYLAWFHEKLDLQPPQHVHKLSYTPARLHVSTCSTWALVALFFGAWAFAVLDCSLSFDSSFCSLGFGGWLFSRYCQSVIRLRYRIACQA